MANRRGPVDSLVPWALTLTALGALAAASAVFAIAHRWNPGWSSYPVLIIAAAYLFAGVRLLTATRPSEYRDLRRALINFADSAGNGVWLNRDARLVFWASRHLPLPARSWSVVRMSEDLIHELGTDAAVRTATVYERYIVFPFTRKVIRVDTAAVITKEEDGTIAGKTLPETPGLLAGWWRTRGLDVGTGWASSAQLRELVGQFAETERTGDREEG